MSVILVQCKRGVGARFLLLCLSLFFLVACSGGKNSGNSANQTAAEIKVLAVPSIRVTLDAAIEEYTTRHPNVKIKVQELGWNSLLGTDGKPNTAALSGADVAVIPSDFARMVVKEKMFRELTSIKLTPRDPVIASLYDTLGKDEGRRYFLPIEIEPLIVLANKQKVEGAGTTIPVDWTTADFHQSLRTLKANGNLPDFYAYMLFDPMLRAFGGGFYDYTTQAWTFDTPANRDGLAFLAGLVKEGLMIGPLPDPGRITATGPGAPAMVLMSGRSFMGPHMVEFPFPKGPKGRSVPATASVGVVLKTATNPEGATAFLQDLVGTESTQEAIARTGVRPVMSSAKAKAVWRQAVGDRVAQVMDLSLEGAYASTGMDTPPRIYGGVQPFLEGTATLDQVLPSLTKLVGN
jgi:ABC-type glycerol-3-phosphate transport system substrate-binding protein